MVPAAHEPETIITVPARAAAMASHVRSATRSPMVAQPSRPAMNGPVLRMMSTLATDVCDRARMKAVEATAKQHAMARPGSPIARNVAGIRVRWRTASTASMKDAAKTPRQNTVVHGPVSTRRANSPPPLQRTAAMATRRAPRRRDGAPSLSRRGAVTGAAGPAPPGSSIPP